MKRITLLTICVLMFISHLMYAEYVRGIDIDFVTIGNPDNPGDIRPNANPANCGAVSYSYQIGKYEVTNGQWNAFVTLAGAPRGNMTHAYDSSIRGSVNTPVMTVSWYEAVQFCNYLTSGDKSRGAYQFSGDIDNPGDFLGIDRGWAVSTYGIAYVLPTENEWYKAAYYKPDGSGYSNYANGLDINPVVLGGWNISGSSYGSLWNVGTGNMEQNGTFDMMGNINEWNETPYDSTSITSARGLRGGTYYTILGIPGGPSSLNQGFMLAFFEDGHVGFRVAAIPEPATVGLLCLGGFALLRRGK